MRALALLCAASTLASVAFAGCTHPHPEYDSMSFLYKVEAGHAFWTEFHGPYGNPYREEGGEAHGGIWIGDHPGAISSSGGLGKCDKDDPNFWQVITLRLQPGDSAVSTYTWNHFDCYAYVMHVDGQGRITLMRADHNWHEYGGPVLPDSHTP